MILEVIANGKYDKQKRSRPEEAFAEVFKKRKALSIRL